MTLRNNWKSQVLTVHLTCTSLITVCATERWRIVDSIQLPHTPVEDTFSQQIGGQRSTKPHNPIHVYSNQTPQDTHIYIDTQNIRSYTYPHTNKHIQSTHAHLSPTHTHAHTCTHTHTNACTHIHTSPAPYHIHVPLRNAALSLPIISSSLH